MHLFPDLNEYFQKGFTNFRLPRTHYKSLMKIIDNTQWYPDPAGSVLKVSQHTVDWQARESDEFLHQNPEMAENPEGLEGAYDVIDIEQYPEEFHRFITEFLLDPEMTGEFQMLYDFEITSFHFWNGVEDTGWHFDMHDNAELLILFYITDETSWDMEWGGYLDIGQRDLKQEGIRIDFSDVQIKCQVMPKNRNVVFITNRNPRIAHRSIPLNVDKNRITLHAGVRFVTKEEYTRPSKVIIK